MAGAKRYRLKIIEKNGFKLEILLVNRDPYAGWDCGRGDCNSCKAEPNNNTKPNCTKMFVSYSARCENCQEGDTLE